jgi:hypothetical protein
MRYRMLGTVMYLHDTGGAHGYSTPIFREFVRLIKTWLATNSQTTSIMSITNHNQNVSKRNFNRAGFTSVQKHLTFHHITVEEFKKRIEAAKFDLFSYGIGIANTTKNITVGSMVGVLGSNGNKIFDGKDKATVGYVTRVHRYNDSCDVWFDVGDGHTVTHTFMQIVPLTDVKMSTWYKFMDVEFILRSNNYLSIRKNSTSHIAYESYLIPDDPNNLKAFILEKITAFKQANKEY